MTSQSSIREAVKEPPNLEGHTELVYAACSLVYADGGADLWFISNDVMLACQGKLFKMLCKMGRDADVRRYIKIMPFPVLSKGLIAACRHGRLHVVSTILEHVISVKSGLCDAVSTKKDEPPNLSKPKPGALDMVEALKRAIRFGHVDIVQKMVTFGAALFTPTSADFPTTLEAGLVCAVQYKRRDILQFLLDYWGQRSLQTKQTSDKGLSQKTGYSMWRMAATVGDTELVDLLPTTAPHAQAWYEQACQDDNWALLLLLHKHCQENVRISDAMLQAMTRSSGVVRHVAWLLEQPLPEITFCLRTVLRRVIKLRDWSTAEKMLKHHKTPVFLDDMQWLCECLLHAGEADKHMPLFRTGLQKVGNPVCLITHALPRPDADRSGPDTTDERDLVTKPDQTEKKLEPTKHHNGAALTVIISCVRRSHILSNLDITRRAILMLARHGTEREASLMSLLELIGQDHDILHPVITRLWMTLAKAQAWSSLTCTLTLTMDSLRAHTWPPIPQDDIALSIAIDNATAANQADLVRCMQTISKLTTTPAKK